MGQRGPGRDNEEGGPLGSAGDVTASDGGRVCAKYDRGTGNVCYHDGEGSQDNKSTKAGEKWQRRRRQGLRGVLKRGETCSYLSPLHPPPPSKQFYCPSHVLFAAFLVLLIGGGVTDGDDDFGRGVFSTMGASVAGRGDDMMVEMCSREAMAMFEGDHNVTGLSRRSGLRWGVAAGLRAVLPPL
jgi:hypothetical protein